MVSIFMWGFFLMLQAACNSFTTLSVLRALAGAAEACSDPSFMLITVMWYTRREQPLRIGLWYTANGIGIALGGLLGYAIGHIRGALASWRYEFIIIGALCCTWGIVIAIYMPDSPVTAKFLNDREKRIAVERLKSNQTGIENKHLKPYQVWEAFSDIKLYFFFILGVVGNIPNGGISNFGTLIIKGTVNTMIFLRLSILTIHPRFRLLNACHDTDADPIRMLHHRIDLDMYVHPLALFRIEGYILAKDTAPVRHQAGH
jgi:MFS family permease